MKKTIDNSIVCFEYILNDDNEFNDYRCFCEENNLIPFDLRNRLPNHILEHAAKGLWEAGYDMDDWYFK